MKKENTFINGEIVSSAEIRKSWKSIVDTVVLLQSLKMGKFHFPIL
ncbi:hypothetical protein ACPTJX_11735 [Enterococcus faecalis]